MLICFDSTCSSQVLLPDPAPIDRLQRIPLLYMHERPCITRNPCQESLLHLFGHGPATSVFEDNLYVSFSVRCPTSYIFLTQDRVEDEVHQALESEHLRLSISRWTHQPRKLYSCSLLHAYMAATHDLSRYYSPVPSLSPHLSQCTDYMRVFIIFI